MIPGLDSIAAKIATGASVALLIALGVVMVRADAISGQRDALRDKLAVEQANHSVTLGSLRGCQSAINRQNAVVADLRAQGEASRQRAENALRDAQRANARADEAIERIRSRTPVDCETGVEILEAEGL